MESFQQAPILPSNAPPWPEIDEDSRSTQSGHEQTGYVQSQPTQDYPDDASDDSKTPALCSRSGGGMSYSQPTRMHSYDYGWMSSTGPSPKAHHRQYSRRTDRLLNFGRHGSMRADLEEFQAEQKARFLASRFSQCEGYIKYRDRQPKKKNKDDQKWPDHIEEAFLRALCRWEPCGRKKKVPPGAVKPMGRNECIAHYILAHTGEPRDRKQVSSHIQVLKPFVLDEPMIMRYLATPSNKPPGAVAAARLARKGRSTYKPDKNVYTNAGSSDDHMEESKGDNNFTHDVYADDSGSNATSLTPSINPSQDACPTYNASWVHGGIDPGSTAALDLHVSTLHDTQFFEFPQGRVAVSFSDADGNTGASIHGTEVLNSTVPDSYGLNMDLQTAPLLLAAPATGVYDFTDIFSPGHSPVGKIGFQALDGSSSLRTEDFNVPFQLQAFAGADMETGRGDTSVGLDDHSFHDQHFGFTHSTQDYDEANTYIHSQPQEDFLFERHASFGHEQSQDDFVIPPQSQSHGQGNFPHQLHEPFDFGSPIETLPVYPHPPQDTHVHSQQHTYDFQTPSQELDGQSQDYMHSQQPHFDRHFDEGESGDVDVVQGLEVSCAVCGTWDRCTCPTKKTYG